MKFIAFTVKGLEKVCVNEIKRILPRSSILEIKEKHLIFEFGGSLADLVQLKTIDDIGLVVA